MNNEHAQPLAADALYGEAKGSCRGLFGSTLTIFPGIYAMPSCYRFFVLAFASCLFAFCLFTNPLVAQNPARAMVVEDHTGSWCGWCVRGNQALEDLHAQYGDRFIPLAFHNGDSMTLPIQGVFAKKFSITGYPSGLVNRENFTVGANTGRILDPDNWAAAVKSLETAKSSIGVSVQWSIDSTTGVLTATASAKMFADLNTQYAFNLVILEDSVSGKGTGWDQTNYLSNRSGYESHPYYYLPSKITDYYHMNVVRAFLGGENGEVGGFPAFARNGESYTHTFTIDLDSVKIQNRKHLWVAVLVVENSGLNRIVNAVSDGKAPTPKSTLWKVDVKTEDAYRMAQRGDSTVFTLTLSNSNDKDVTAIVNIDKNFSYAPDDWTVRFEPKSVPVAAGGTNTVKMIVKLGSAIGYANYKLTTEIKPFDNIRSLPLSTTVGVLSDNVRYAVARFDSDEGHELDPLMESYRMLPSYKDQGAVVACNDSTIKHFDFSAFDVLLLPESYATRTAIIFSKKMVEMMQKRVDSYRPMLITSPMDMWFTADNYGSMVSADVKKFFNETLGFTGAKRSWGPWLWNGSLRRSSVVGVQSYSGQDVQPAMDFNVNETDSVYTVQDHWLDELSILDSERVHRIFRFYGEKITDDSSVAAVYTKVKNTAVIYQGFSFGAIKDEPLRRTLLNNYLSFLMKVTDVPPADLNSAGLRALPLPAAQTLTIQHTSDVHSGTLRVVDTRGLETFSAPTASGSTSTHLDVAALPAGTYYVLLERAGVMSACKVVVAR